MSPPSAISVQTAPKSPVVIDKAALFPDTPVSLLHLLVDVFAQSFKLTLH